MNFEFIFLCFIFGLRKWSCVATFCYISLAFHHSFIAFIVRTIALLLQWVWICVVLCCGCMLLHLPPFDLYYVQFEKKNLDFFVLLHCWHMPSFFYYNSCAYNCLAFTTWGSKKENLKFFCFDVLLTPTIIVFFPRKKNQKIPFWSFSPLSNLIKMPFWTSSFGLVHFD